MALIRCCHRSWIIRTALEASLTPRIDIKYLSSFSLFLVLTNNQSLHILDPSLCLLILAIQECVSFLKDMRRLKQSEASTALLGENQIPQQKRPEFFKAVLNWMQYVRNKNEEICIYVTPRKTTPRTFQNDLQQLFRDCANKSTLQLFPGHWVRDFCSKSLTNYCCFGWSTQKNRLQRHTFN